MPCQLILNALSYYLLACGNYTSNCNTLFNTTTQSIILCDQKNVKQVIVETPWSGSNITNITQNTTETTTVASMVETTTSFPQASTTTLSHNLTQYPLLRGSIPIVNLTNTSMSNESAAVNQTNHTNIQNITNETLSIMNESWSIMNESFTESSADLYNEDKIGQHATHGLTIGLASGLLLIIVIAAYKCNKMGMCKKQKKKRKSIKTVSPEPEPPKNRNSWTANTADIKLKMHKKRPVEKPFENVTPSAPPPLPRPKGPPPPVPSRAMKVKDLHKKDSLNMLKQIRSHKNVKKTGVQHLKRQMLKIKAANKLNKK